MKTSSRIVTDSNILFGKPRIAGSRISVEQILECLSQNWSIPEITKNFRGITREDIQACLEYSQSLCHRVRTFSFNSQEKTLCHSF